MIIKWKNTHGNRRSDCSFFEKDSLEFFYWLGFIMADGHISNCRLSISLSKKDEFHLKKLADKLKVKMHYIKSNGYNQCRIALMNKDVICSIVDRFSIDSNKTIVPCNISSIKGSDLLALKIGFIDGDGNIRKLWKRKDFSIRVKAHKNWIDNLKIMFPNENCYINNQGYSCVTISNSVTCKSLKQFILDNGLPVLKRKWDNIDMNFVSKIELSKIRIKKVSEMLLKNKTKKEIKTETGLSDSGLSILISKNKLT